MDSSEKNKEETKGEKERRSSSSSSSLSQLETLREKKAFPFCIFFILGNEFCERYSFYGMRTILVLYLKYYLEWDENTSTAVYHAFTVLAYLFPLVGAMIADSWWGKYKTILILSVVYAIGMIVNTLGAVGTLGDLTVHAVLSSIGLFIIAFGTGGIKPCVSAFGGDQFEADQEDYRRSFFSLFYFAINAGSLISTFVSPIIREEVQCFGDDCYALAFGIPAVLMVVAIILFIVGTPWYKRNPPQGNIFAKVTVTIFRAIKNRFAVPKKERNREHWLDYADDGTNAIMIRDIKYVLNVLVLFIPLPLFWALFDQQGSRWTLQAVRMDGYVGTLRILPDQMQICNPLMIVVLIPVFEVTLYPCLRHFNINFSPLRRMTAGMLLAGVSFVIAAVVQMQIDINLTKVPETAKETSLRVINSAGCSLWINSDIYPEWNSGEGSGGFTLAPAEATDETLEQFVQPGKYVIHYGCVGSEDSYQFTAGLVEKEVFDLIISDNNMDDPLLTTHPIEKSDNGDAVIGIANVLNSAVYYQVVGQPIAGMVEANKRVDLESIKGRGLKEMMLSSSGVNVTRSFTVGTGGLYTFVTRDNDSTNVLTKADFSMDEYTDIYQNDVNIFWMIPQYFIITLGEVFLSVTGLEFAYSQAPPSMKSVLTSFWLFAVSIGNIIVLIIAEARFLPNQVDEYFLFAGLIGAATIVFIILAVRYEYVDESEFLEEDDQSLSIDHNEKRKISAKKNEAFQHDTEL